jgi:NAD-dependent dihydropyrimidine dehydrogenase PreA subunit
MNEYTQLVIYYFSGTGNALSAARSIAEIAKEKGVEIVLISIDRLKKIELPSAEGKRLIGFCYPTHGFNLPWIMLKFILRFPKGKSDFFLLNTRAGMKMGRLRVRGLSGIAQHLPLLILFLKGYKIKGLIPIDLPSNWISVHPGLRPEVVSYLYDRCLKEIKAFTENLLERKSSFALWYFIAIPIDLLIFPLTLGYFIYGRFFFSKTFIAGSDCNLCRLCEQRCPTESIIIRDNRPYWRFTCESCMRCINICPSKSIQSSHSLAALIITASTMVPITIWINSFLVNCFPDLVAKPIFEFLLKWPAVMAIYFLSYLFIFYLMKLKFINRFFVYTSLTKYWRRYWSPNVTTADFKISKE